MVSFELNEAGFVDEPVLSADDRMPQADLAIAPGIGDGFVTDTIADEFGDEEFGGAGEADDRFEIADQPGAPIEERIVATDGLRAAKLLEDESALLDVEDLVPDTADPEISEPIQLLRFDGKRYSATVSDERGDIGHVEARVTLRGKNQELVIDDIGVLETHLETDIPEQLLAVAAETSKRHGILTVDSKVGNVRGLDARIRVFGEGSLTFHDPEHKHGDVDLGINTEQAARYLAPGDRTPLHVRAVIWNRPYANMVSGEVAPESKNAAGDALIPAAVNAEEPAEEYRDDAADVIADDEWTSDLAGGSDEDTEVAANGTILNEASFTHFYETHYDMVVRYTTRQFGLSREDAEELAQTTFMKAWAGRASFDGTNAEAWLTTLARNSGINKYRADASRPQQEVNGERNDRALDRAQSEIAQPEEALLSAAASEELLKTFDEVELPAAWRQIMIMRVGLSMQYKEIAERMGIPIGTVTSSIHRATKRLQTHAVAQR